MAVYKVRKRNGAIVSFDRKKIEDAIKKAIESVWWSDFSKVSEMAGKVLETLEHKIWKNIPDVETIQDTVEQVLIKEWHDTVAKSYIVYRQKRAEQRADKNVVVEVWATMEEYLNQTDWRVNANSNQWYSLGWLILNVSWKVTANYRLSHIYPSEVGSAHRNGDVHIHDLDMFSAYCAGWSLRQLIEEWFNGLNNRVQSAPPKNLQAAVNQMINFLWTLQNERAGAQAFSSFDTYLAPFIHKFAKEVEEELDDLWVTFSTPEERKWYISKKTYKYVYQQMQNFVFWLNVPSRRWTQTPFTNITLDWTCPQDLKEKALFLWWVKNWAYEKKFGELQEEMKMINRVLIDVYTKWDRTWAVFTFPIPTYNITEDFPREDPDIDALFEMTAKYWIPYFQNFVWSQFKREKDENWNIKKVENPNAYKPGAVRSMCCRLQLDLTQLEKRWNWLFWSAEMTWSVWVVTINMARIWHNFKGDMDWFKNQVKYLMNIAKTSLEIKRKELTSWLDRWFYPYTKRYLHSFRNHFSTIWLNWMNEAVLNFTDGKEDVTTEFWMAFAIEILDYMRDILKVYQEETWNLYNLEATPAEWTTYRFAREDKKQIPWIIQAWTPEAPYYTNSSQIPVTYTDDVFEALDLQDELQCKYTWWTVLHLYLWERPNTQSCKQLVKKVISNYQLPYITISPVFSICPIHGYVVGEHDYCPRCDEEQWYIGEKFDLETRKKYTSDEKKLEELSQVKIGE